MKMVNLEHIYNKSLRGERISFEEALSLYNEVPLWELCSAADSLRRYRVENPNVVTWQIDRNVNITNVCISGCKFCNFHVKPHQVEQHFITSREEYYRKIEQTFRFGGDQLLLQGGLHPKLDVVFYEELFRDLKSRYPQLKLNALGAPEISHIARISNISVAEVLKRLHSAGLDTLPGAGAEILVDDIRRVISPAKPSASEWLSVMHEAHMQDIPSTATMMYGHVETPQQRVEHLILLRDLQAQKPKNARGFTAFIPWIFRSTGTELELQGYHTNFSPTEYLRIVALSRIVLNNIVNIQASWLTVGKATAQMALHAGANDMGSIMIEENVVSAAGADNRFDREGIQQAIREAGFEPRLRDQLYNFRDLEV